MKKLADSSSMKGKAAGKRKFVGIQNIHQGLISETAVQMQM